MSPTGRRWTRRGFLFSGLAAAGLAAEGPKLPSFPSGGRRYSDPSTDLDVYRLTDPAHSSTLPAYYGRAIARNGGYLLFTCDRTGSPQPFRLDLATGETRQLAETAGLDASTLTLTPDYRSFCYCAGRSLFLAALAGKLREVYRVPVGWERARGMAVGAAGATLVETGAGRWRLRLIPLGRGEARTLVESEAGIADPRPRPSHSETLYSLAGQGLWLVGRDGHPNRRLHLAEGTVSAAIWAPGGRTLLYLLRPSDPTQLHAIREHFPETGADRLVSKTSQFASFSANRDTSVFAGASENRASPLVLLLLRATGTERTLCEHRASDPASVCPVFSPNSQRLYFQSDREGKPAIYAMHLDKLVEDTAPVPEK